MQELILIQDMAIVMVVSAIAMILCHCLRLPVVLGYIFAGLFIGPHTPPYSFVSDIHSIHTLSSLGIIFLLFSIGLEFSFSKLAKVGVVAFFASTLEIVLMIAIGFFIGKALGLNQMDSLFLGAILSISSTTIIAKILIEQKIINEKFAQVILGILVVEDLWAIIIIAILSGIAMTGTLTLAAISLSMLKVIIFVTLFVLIGLFLIPRLLRFIERFQLSEMMVIVVLGCCLGGALIAAKTGFSIALGAFLIGAIIAETKQAHQIIQKMEPIRDMFTAIFFVSVGMLIEPVVIAKYALPICIITVITIFGKVFSCSLATFIAGYESKTALKVGLGLAQIGEFSFIIAQLGVNTQVTSSFLYPIAVAVSAITTLTTPFLMNHANSIIAGLKKVTPRPMMTLAMVYPQWVSSLNQPDIAKLFPNFIQSYKRINKLMTSLIVSDTALNKAGAKAAHEQMVDLIRSNYPLNFETADFILPLQGCGLNKTIKELDLRFQTGASIVGIYRDESVISNPAPTIGLLPGDVLLLIGDKDQLKKAISFLQSKIS